MPPLAAAAGGDAGGALDEAAEEGRVLVADGEAETAQAMLQTAGFVSIDKRVLEHDPLDVWFISTKAG